MACPGGEAHHRISQAICLGACWNCHRFRRGSRNGWRGFIGPVPPPLWMRPAMWSTAYRKIRRTMSATDDPLSPRHAEPAQAPDRSSRRALARRPASPPEPQEARVEIVEAPGLRWIHIERPRAVDQAWLEERFDFHPLDYEDVFSRNQRPKVDEYDDYLFIVLHFPRYDKAVSRLNAAEVDIFVGPDYLITLPNEPLQPVEYLFERCRTNEELREKLFSKGAGLPALQDRRRLGRRLVPDAAQDRQQARAHRGGHLRGRAGRGRARHLQRQAGDHQLPQDRPPAARRVRATSSAPRRATSPTTSTSTSTTSSTPPSGSGTCSRTTRRWWRRSRRPTSR